MLTLIVKLYKTISIKYNLKQNITILSSIAHGFLNILTADKVNDLKSARSKKLPKSSHHLPNISDNPLDESPLNPKDTTNISQIQLVLFHHRFFIQNVQIESPK